MTRRSYHILNAHHNEMKGEVNMEIIVRETDSLTYYSELFDIPAIMIYHSNPDIDSNELLSGMRIQIPGYVKFEYIVKETDSIQQIIQQYHTSWEHIQLLNPKTELKALHAGQIIYLSKRVNQRLITDVNDYTYGKMLKDINELIAVYPFISKMSIGNSVLGKDIIELHIGRGKKELHTNGAFHANEWITTPVLIQFLNDYAIALTNQQPIKSLSVLSLYNQTSLSVVPMVNPDGVDLAIEGSSAARHLSENVLQINNHNKDFSNWKANINGVDLNDQFPAFWELEEQRKPKFPAARDYPGKIPLSEPEAVTMANLVQERDFLRLNAFHTQGEVIYYGFEGFEPHEADKIVDTYAQMSGYTPVRYVDSYAGFKDWFIQKYQRPGFTIELGKGVNPLSIEKYPKIYDEALGILLANLYLE